MSGRRRRRPARRKTGNRTGRSPSRRGLGWRLALVLLLLLAGYSIWLDMRITRAFEGQRWALPARVLARPLELYAGQRLGPEDVVRELELLRYRSQAGAPRPGTYARAPGRLLIHTRGFLFPDGEEPPQRLRLRFADGRITALETVSGQPIRGIVRVEPLLIANIYPARREDRVLVRLDQVPPLLVDTLIAVEDKSFWQHHGVRPLAIARALIANLRAGRTVQGGSTLTQQLVKNYFLSGERSLWRKANEALMALLMELHYDKKAILEAYLNEIYLGQSGDNAIHGFGLGSQFYFGKRLDELAPEQIALLVALIKGPSYYNPRRHPRRALQRRNLVLEIMARDGLIPEDRLALLKQRPLGVLKRPPPSRTPFPAFLDLVRQQLHRDYPESVLRSAGLMVFTTLDPLYQLAAERAVRGQLKALGSRGRGLQAALVLVSLANGEVQALVGGRNPRFAGFNRALSARRPIGSLIKPLVYQEALSHSDRYTWATLVDDAPIRLRQPDGSEWRPENYDHQAHGRVPLIEALVHSWNLATARVGMEVGVARVAERLQRLGGPRARPLPSMLLGSVEMTPFEVARVYTVLASEGYRMPLRAIRAVTDRAGNLQQRYPLKVEQRVDSRLAFLTLYGMHQVTRRGTAKRLASEFPDRRLAGKTGTTDELRDSWFAGFDADHLAVVWVGRDDNRTSGLTGASGALPIWAALYRALPYADLDLEGPDGVEWAWIDLRNGGRSGEDCPHALRMPFIAGTVPATTSDCGGGPARSLQRGLRRSWDWLQDLFGDD